jgi:hypothetical protein
MTRLPGEKTDLWIVRFNYRVPSPYWGFWQFRDWNKTDVARTVVANARGVLFLGGNATDAAAIRKQFPGLEGKSFGADTRTYQKLYAGVFTEQQTRDLNTPDPSSGLLGEQTVCIGHSQVRERDRSVCLRGSLPLLLGPTGLLDTFSRCHQAWLFQRDGRCVHECAFDFWNWSCA